MKNNYNSNKDELRKIKIILNNNKMVLFIVSVIISPF